mgnify:CR=1 FL=1
MLFRSLLLSDNLANSSDQVGRNLMHHTLTACDIWVDEPMESHMGFVGSLISMEFAETDVSRGFVNGFNFNCATTGHAGGQSLGMITPTNAWLERGRFARTIREVDDFLENLRTIGLRDR